MLVSCKESKTVPFMKVDIQALPPGIWLDMGELMVLKSEGEALLLQSDGRSILYFTNNKMVPHKLLEATSNYEISLRKKNNKIKNDLCHQSAIQL